MAFMVSDILVGIAGSGYAIINEGTLVEVLEVYGEDSIKGKIIAQKNPKFRNSVNKEYDLGIICNKTGKVALEKATPEQIEDISPVLGASMRSSASSTEAAVAAGAKVMEFKGNLKIVVYTDGRVETNWNENRDFGPETKRDRITAFTEFVNEMDSYHSKDMYPSLVSVLAQKKYEAINGMFTEAAMETGIQRFMDFFKEFQYVPSFRTLNSVALIAAENIENAIARIVGHFRIVDNAYVDAVVAKVKSPEFKLILNQLSLTNAVYSGNVINNRLKIYFGEPGTGKTTKATEESDNRCVICHSEMSPKDLLKEFDFDADGHPTFKKSMLRLCIENGWKITLDEINFLSRETFKFLQGITDGKKTFDFEGETITIADGFQIIGTMNLMQEGTAIGIPEPMADRCSEIVEFVPTAHSLLAALK